MTINDAIASAISNPSRNAMKRDSMGGYFFVTEVTEEGSDTRGFSLTMRKRANDGSGQPVDYVYGFGFAKGASPNPGDLTFTPRAGLTPSLSGELFAMMLCDDWKVGKQSDFETVRVGGPGEW